MTGVLLLNIETGVLQVVLQLKPMHNLIILELQIFKYHYFGHFLLYSARHKHCRTRLPRRIVDVVH